MTPTTVRAGTRLGPYLLEASIGAGGMAEVFRAVDTRLERPVAVKLLPPSLVSDPEALARLEREARAVAALTHPNVLTIHDVGHDSRTAYLVTELLEGETLRERLEQGPIPARRAVELGVQVALGLAAAHEKGIVHRDLKPDNVFLTREGLVKLLDFGLAHAVHAATPVPVLGPDADPRLTDPSGTVGTPAYMSPEQVRGGALDGRSDIFAFGSLVYEMLTGERAFNGATTDEVMLAILRSDPKPLPAERGVPPAVERIVSRCLEKERAARFQSARDLAFALETVTRLSAPAVLSQTEAPPRPQPRLRRAAAALALAAALGGGILAGRLLTRGRPPAMTALRPLTYTGSEGFPSVSPDGRLIAYASGRAGGTRIWLMQMPAGAESPLSAGPGDTLPSFSPHGDELLFLRGINTHATLFRLGVLGGEERLIANDVAGAAFLPPDGEEIVFLRQVADGPPLAYALFVAGRDGAHPREIARATGDLLGLPRPSPDGSTIAVLAIPSTANRGSAYLLFPRAGGAPARLEVPASLGRLWAPAWSERGDALVYTQVTSVRYGSSRLFVHPLRGGSPRALFLAPFEMRGVALMPGPRLAVESHLFRCGIREGPIGSPLPRLTSGAGTDRQPVYSPDGRWLNFSSNRQGNLEIWSLSLAGGRTRPLTSHPSDDWDPGFMRDGRLIWSSGRSGNLEIWIANADGSAPRLVTHDGVDAENPTSSPDGWIVYRSGNPARPGIWKVRDDGSNATFLVPDPVLCPEVSPDGQFIAYVIPALPGTQAVVRVARTADGSSVPFEVPIRLATGTEVVVGRPRWMADGRAVAFISMAPDGGLLVEAQDFRPGTDTSATRRQLAPPVFEGEIETFALSPDGKRIALSVLEHRAELYLLEGVDGLPSPPPPPSR